MTQPVIESVSFVVPCIVTLIQDNNPIHVRGEIDYPNRRFYLEGKLAPPAFRDAVFALLTNITHPPEDSFQPPEGLYEDAARAQEDFEQAKEQHLGGLDE